jgi:hypothetical protein
MHETTTRPIVMTTARRTIRGAITQPKRIAAMRRSMEMTRIGLGRRTILLRSTTTMITE